MLYQYGTFISFNFGIHSKNNNSVYLLSAHSIRFDAHSANYYYPGYAWPLQRHTRQTRKNPTGTHFTTPWSRETIVDKMPCLRAYTTDPLIRGESTFLNEDSQTKIDNWFSQHQPIYMQNSETAIAIN